jgi:hypothetical protein
MFESIPSYFYTNISFFILLAIALISGLISYFVYRRTIPPVSKNWSFFLGILLTISLACICTLFFIPELTLIWQRSEKNRIIFVLDKSASMGIEKNGERRIDTAKNIIDKISTKIASDSRVTLYAFDLDTSKIHQKLPDTTGGGTNIHRALKSIVKAEKDPEAIILLSDGNFTSGENPLYADFLNKIKLYTIGIGDTLEMPDILIADIKYNKLVYQNKPTQVEVDVLLRGIEQTSVSVTLRRDRKIVAIKKIEIKGDNSILPVQFIVNPEKLGLNRFEVEVEGLVTEKELQNNKNVFMIEVLKGKIHAALIASQPNFDVKFLRMLLSDIEDVRLSTAVASKGSQTFHAPINKVFDSLDVLILHDFPSRSTNREHVSVLNRELKNKRIPMLVIVSQQFTADQIQGINTFFPLKSVRLLATPVTTQVTTTPEGGVAPLLNVFDNLADNEKFWLKCPPIEYRYAQVQFDSESKILLQTQAILGDKNTQMPILILDKQKGRKSLLLLGAGFWRWHFSQAEERQFQLGWKKILHNMMRWLSSGGQDNNVVLTTAKKSYQVGENVQVKSQVYDGSYIVVNDAMVKLLISGPTGSFEVESEFISDGNYSTKFMPISDGEYKVEATAWLNDVEMGRAKTEIYVTPVNNEFTYTRQDYRLLKKLAEKSGGKYFNSSDASNLPNSLNLSSKLVREEETFELWNKLPMLLSIILLLCVEWFIRKRKGLA